jgi:ComF family protein
MLRELLPTVQQQSLQAARDTGWEMDAASAYCGRCGATAGPGATTARGCARCLDRRLPWQRVLRVGPYSQPLSEWIVAMKFSRQWAWAAQFGRMLGEQMQPPPGPTVVCYVPMHWLRRLRRGYNQAQLMAAALAQQRRWPLVHVLRRARHTRPQTHVPPSQRHANVRRSFTIAPVSLTGFQVVLVDDVTTSGATLTACARLLRKAGAESVQIAVAAVARPHQDRPPPGPM